MFETKKVKHTHKKIGSSPQVYLITKRNRGLYIESNFVGNNYHFMRIAGLDRARISSIPAYPPNCIGIFLDLHFIVIISKH